MDSYTANNPAAISRAMVNFSKSKDLHYKMELNYSDLDILLRALWSSLRSSDLYNDERDEIFSLYSSILSTLDVELI